MSFTPEQEERIAYYQDLIRKAWSTNSKLPAKRRPAFKLDQIKLDKPEEKEFLGEAYIRLVNQR